MRDFTELERNLLVRINDGTGKNLYSLIDPWIQGISFRVDYINNTLLIIFEVNDIEPISIANIINNRLQEIQSVVIQVVNLLKLFEDKGYFFLYINATQLPENPFTFGQATINLSSTSYQFPDPRIAKLFVEYSMREIFVTPELNRFISDGFITREEVRANRQFNITRRALRVTTIALVISIAALLVNIGFNILKKSPQNIEIKSSDVYIHGKRNKEMIYCQKIYGTLQKQNPNDTVTQ